MSVRILGIFFFHPCSPYEEGKIKEFFGNNADKPESSDQPVDDTEAGETTLPASSASSETTTSTSSSASASPSADKKLKEKGREKEKEDLSTIPLKLVVNPLSIPALTPAEIRKSREKLACSH